MAAPVVASQNDVPVQAISTTTTSTTTSTSATAQKDKQPLVFDRTMDDPAIPTLEHVREDKLRNDLERTAKKIYLYLRRARCRPAFHDDKKRDHAERLQKEALTLMTKEPVGKTHASKAQAKLTELTAAVTKLQEAVKLRKEVSYKENLATTLVTHAGMPKKDELATEAMRDAYAVCLQQIDSDESVVLLDDTLNLRSKTEEQRSELLKTKDVPVKTLIRKMFKHDKATAVNLGSEWKDFLKFFCLLRDEELLELWGGERAQGKKRTRTEDEEDDEMSQAEQETTAEGIITFINSELPLLSGFAPMMSDKIIEDISIANKVRQLLQREVKDSKPELTRIIFERCAKHSEEPGLTDAYMEARRHQDNRPLDRTLQDISDILVQELPIHLPQQFGSPKMDAETLKHFVNRFLAQAPAAVTAALAKCGAATMPGHIRSNVECQKAMSEIWNQGDESNGSLTFERPPAKVRTAWMGKVDNLTGDELQIRDAAEECGHDCAFLPTIVISAILSVEGRPDGIEDKLRAPVPEVRFAGESTSDNRRKLLSHNPVFTFAETRADMSPILPRDVNTALVLEPQYVSVYMRNSEQTYMVRTAQSVFYVFYKPQNGTGSKQDNAAQKMTYVNAFQNRIKRPDPPTSVCATPTTIRIVPIAEAQKRGGHTFDVGGSRLGMIGVVEANGQYEDIAKEYLSMDQTVMCTDIHSDHKGLIWLPKGVHKDWEKKMAVAKWALTAAKQDAWKDIQVMFRGDKIRVYDPHHKLDKDRARELKLALNSALRCGGETSVSVWCDIAARPAAAHTASIACEAHRKVIDEQIDKNKDQGDTNLKIIACSDAESGVFYAPQLVAQLQDGVCASNTELNGLYPFRCDTPDTLVLTCKDRATYDRVANTLMQFGDGSVAQFLSVDLFMENFSTKRATYSEKGAGITARTRVQV